VTLRTPEVINLIISHDADFGVEFNDCVRLVIDSKPSYALTYKKNQQILAL